MDKKTDNKQIDKSIDKSQYETITTLSPQEIELLSPKFSSKSARINRIPLNNIPLNNKTNKNLNGGVISLDNLKNLPPHFIQNIIAIQTIWRGFSYRIKVLYKNLYAKYIYILFVEHLKQVFRSQNVYSFDLLKNINISMNINSKKADCNSCKKRIADIEKLIKESNIKTGTKSADNYEPYSSNYSKKDSNINNENNNNENINNENNNNENIIQNIKNSSFTTLSIDKQEDFSVHKSDDRNASYARVQKILEGADLEADTTMQFNHTDHMLKKSLELVKREMSKKDNEGLNKIKQGGDDLNEENMSGDKYLHLLHFIRIWDQITYRKYIFVEYTN